MITPDFKQLNVKSKKEVAEFWFNYWNELYPVKDLVLDFGPHCSNNSYGGLADVNAKRTYFSLADVKSDSWNYYHTARHEQVHHLLNEYDYSVDHTIQFAIVDGALNYAFHKARGVMNPRFNISFYDMHEDELAGDGLNIRMLSLAIKRLSRYSHDIALLLQKSDIYAQWISQCTKTRKPSFNYKNRYNQALIEQQNVLEHWENSEAEHKAKTKNLQLIIAGQKQALTRADEKFGALNRTNAIWQGAFVALLICTIWLLTK